eukprot:jgi/Botrbrau1/12490/Bobra.0169s0037.1
MESVALALDWTPNTNHTGFYVAKYKNLYKEKGLNVHFISPHLDDYHCTPASRVHDGSAIFALGPSESVISSHCSSLPQKSALKAVAAVLQADLSAIVTLQSSGIKRPQQLDGKKYASYGARYEGRIVQQLIRNDGGTGNFLEDTPAMLGIWETLVKGQADATWVFMGWEGVEAEQRGLPLNAFRLEDYSIPYGYSPVLLAHPSTIQERAEVVQAFLEATAEGFKYAAEHPEEAADILCSLATSEAADKPLPTPLDPEMVKASQLKLSQAYLDGNGKWGRMEVSKWEAFLDWLSDKGLLTTLEPSRTPVEGLTTSLDALRGGQAGAVIPRESIDASALFTNDFLP